MRKYFSFLAVFFLWQSLAAADVSTDKWHLVKSRHFIVYYQDAREDFIAQLIRKAEDYYDEIAERLGFRRYNFWLWDNRAKIYIYDDAASYQAATGRPHWSFGSAIAEKKIIYTFPNEQGFFDRILPHEMGHIIFREFVGFDNPAIPIWLEEGVASNQEEINPLGVKAVVKDALKKGTFVDINNLAKFDPQGTQDSEVVKIFYAEAISIVDYLIQEFGADSFEYFCKNLRDKKDFIKALSASYPFKGIAELDEAWQEYLKK